MLWDRRGEDGKGPGWIGEEAWQGDHPRHAAHCCCCAGSHRCTGSSDTVGVSCDPAREVGRCWGGQCVLLLGRSWGQTYGNHNYLR